MPTDNESLRQAGWVRTEDGKLRREVSGVFDNAGQAHPIAEYIPAWHDNAQIRTNPRGIEQANHQTHAQQLLAQHRERERAELAAQEKKRAVKAQAQLMSREAGRQLAHEAGVGSRLSPQEIDLMHRLKVQKAQEKQALQAQQVEQRRKYGESSTIAAIIKALQVTNPLEQQQLRNALRNNLLSPDELNALEQLKSKAEVSNHE